MACCACTLEVVVVLHVLLGLHTRPPEVVGHGFSLVERFQVVHSQLMGSVAVLCETMACAAGLLGQMGALRRRSVFGTFVDVVLEGQQGFMLTWWCEVDTMSVVLERSFPRGWSPR